MIIKIIIKLLMKPKLKPKLKHKIRYELKKETVKVQMEQKYRIAYTKNLENILSYLTFFDDKISFLCVNSKFNKIIRSDPLFDVSMIHLKF